MEVLASQSLRLFSGLATVTGWMAVARVVLAMALDETASHTAPRR